MELVDKINYLLLLKVFLMVVALSINNKLEMRGRGEKGFNQGDEENGRSRKKDCI